MEALLTRVPVGKYASVSIKVFGPVQAQEYGLTSGWSLAKLQSMHDVPSSRLLMQILSKELLGFGVKKAFAPHVAALSGAIVSSDRLRDEIRFRSEKVALYRNANLPADGVPLQLKEAFVMSGAGCPLILASNGSRVIVAHAGRDSLVDRASIRGTFGRQYISVVDAIVDNFKAFGELPQNIAMTMLFSIPPEEFEHSPQHPEYGEYNSRLIKFIDARWPGCFIDGHDTFYLDLQQLFIAQAMNHGIKYVSAQCSLSQFPRLARKASDLGNRNLFIVKRET